MLRKFCTCQSQDILQVRLSALAAPCLSSFHTVRSIMVTIKLRIKCNRHNNIARDSFPCRRIELELNKQSPFARSFNRRKTFAFDLVDICWDQTRGEVIVRKILKNKITCSSNLVSETSSFLVNILFASSKKNLKSGKFLVICIHCEAKTSTSTGTGN